MMNYFSLERAVTIVLQILLIVCTSIIHHSSFINQKMRFSFFIIFIPVLIIGCSNDDHLIRPTGPYIPPPTTTPTNPTTGNNVANIDLSKWKVTLPIANSSGNPIEITPPTILDYANNTTLQPFMYNDTTDASIVFYTYNGGATTANSSYPRTELRELMDGGNGTVNWTFAQGGRIKGKLAMQEMAKDASGDYYRTIIMQIHGRLTDAQKNLIGQGDNNAPPMLKIYWVDGKVRVKTKELKDLNATYEELLETGAWGDDDGYTFPEYVGFNPFTLEVIVTDGRMEVVLNETASKVYNDVHIQKWGVFENYFKAGNYLVSTDSNAYAKVKYYELEVTH
jgi:hypothetical protein